MKLKETIFVGEWHDGVGFSYETLVSIKTVDFPYLLNYDPEEFNWNDYRDYYSLEFPKEVDYLITVEFSTPDDGVVYSNSEWASSLKVYDDIDDDVSV